MEVEIIEQLFKAVDLVTIAAIIALTQAIKRALPEEFWRLTPLITVALGVAAGLITAETTDPRLIAKSVLLNSGAASLAYELGRTTLLGKGAKKGESQ
jgi:hypothetical protein